MITVATVGRPSTQLSATWGTLLSVSFATASSASTTRNRCSSSTFGPPSNAAFDCKRLASGIFAPRRIFPVSRPPPRAGSTPPRRRP